jgi:hypothetical protein
VEPFIYKPAQKLLEMARRLTVPGVIKENKSSGAQLTCEELEVHMQRLWASSLLGEEWQGRWHSRALGLRLGAICTVG